MLTCLRDAWSLRRDWAWKVWTSQRGVNFVVHMNLFFDIFDIYLHLKLLSIMAS